MTIQNAATLQQQLRDWSDQHVAQLDLSEVAECDSAGVQLLCAAHRSARQGGRELALVAPSEAVQEALARYGLDAQLQPCRPATFQPQGV